MENDKNFMRILKALDKLSEDERITIFSYYCKHCGTRQPWHPFNPNIDNPLEPAPILQGCQCWNDE